MVRQVQSGPRGPRGFTLIELTIVLLILVAIAGVMIPFMNGYVDKAHSGAAAANIESITRQVESYKVKHLFKGYPDHLDSLINPAAVTQWDGLPAAVQALVTPANLTAAQVTSLNEAGITTLKNSGSLVPGTNNVTFDTPATNVTIAVTSNVLTVTDADALALNVPNNNTTDWTYVLFGLGNGCDIVGTDIAEAPVHFDTLDPATTYQHYGLIFAVPTAANTSGATHLVATVGIHDAGLSGIRDHLTEFNNSNQ
jgi:prepilin-type N-terminal cleavage/methylation domain-containing protein